MQTIAVLRFFIICSYQLCYNILLLIDTGRALRRMRSLF